MKRASEKYWNPDNSIASTIRHDASSPLSHSSDSPSHLKRETSGKQLLSNKNFDVDSENEDDFNFLKNKQEADQNFLSKLNSVQANSELRVENVDLSQLKRRNASSRDHQTSFLYSPSQSSVNSERNTSSKLSNHPSGRFQIKTPIPPAEKMEVVVGKGRRVNSASSRTPKNNLPPTPKNSNGKASSSFRCIHCQKNYDNSKDLEIHKLYCN